jgi:hypothetical protein
MVNQKINTKRVILTVIWGIDGFHVVDGMPPGGVSTPSTYLFILWILYWPKSFWREAKAMHFDLVSTWIIIAFIL